MLNMEALIEEAKLRNLPVEKKRAIVREYAQIIMLGAIYRSSLGQKIFFMGGTALRFAYGLPRFSEDMDFNGERLSRDDFLNILKIAKKGLEKEGFSCEISEREKGSLLVGRVKLTRILQRYEIAAAKDEKLLIKVEVNRPTWELTTESLIITGFGYGFPALLMTKGAILAEKLHALINRRRGRDIYDVLFMLRRKFPVDRDILETLGFHGNINRVILDHLNSLGKKELERLARQVQPFLFREEEVDLVSNAPHYAEKFLEGY